MTTDIAPRQGHRLFRRKPPRLLLNGKRIHLRGPQTLGWSSVAAVLGASTIAGLYFLGFEQVWHVPLLHYGSSSAKLWWDGGMNFIHSGNWYLERHGIRDLGEPAVATMGIRTLLAKPKYWDVVVSTRRLVITPLAVLGLTLVMSFGGIWVLIKTGLVNDTGRTSAGQIALGVIIGLVLHRTWAPVGATLQRFVIGRAVARAKARGKVPVWVSKPLAPPVVRERFCEIYRSGKTEQAKGTHRAALSVVTFLLVVITFVGLIAKFWIAHGHGFPYLTN